MKRIYANANHEMNPCVPFRKALMAAGALAVLSSPFALNPVFAAKPPALEKTANKAAHAENKPDTAEKAMCYAIFAFGAGAFLYKYRPK
ncbi:MAG: hypothetical protein PHV13_03830 [Candidatus ainarchaeum sp.]|nr:hypothetical protein [Candidatus ainarchaeum sp.]